MAIRLTPEVKAYLEYVLAKELKYIRLSVVPTEVEGEMSYMITWTKEIAPLERFRTARDWNVIVIERKYEHFFGDILLGLDPSDRTKVVILDNPNVLVRENGNILVLNG